MLDHCNYIYVYMFCFPEIYYFGEFLNEHSLVQIPFNAPPSIITTNISFYINFPLIFDYISFYINFPLIFDHISWFGSPSPTMVAHLTLVSSYSGISLPVNNTILPVVTLVAPNGTEGTVIDIPLQNDSDYAKHCYKTLQDIAFMSVQVNIHSPLMYTQLGQHDFVVELQLFSPDSNLLSIFLQYLIKDRYTLAVNITNNGNLHLQTLHVLSYNHLCIL